MSDMLNILVSEDHEIPIYLQIAHQLTYLIYSHQLRDDEQLPAVRVLAEQLKVNPNTVSQAYYELQNSGLITSQRGRGTFVKASNNADATDWGVRHDLLVAEMSRLRQRAHALGFVDADVQSQLFGVIQGSRQVCDVAVITPGRSAAKYAKSMGDAMEAYGLELHPVTTESLAANDPRALEVLERCYFVITLVSIKQQVEDLLLALPSEHSVIVTSLDLTPATIGRIAEIPEGQAICVFSPQRYQPIAINILHGYSLVEHRSITKVLDNVPKAAALEAFDAADLIVHTFSSGPILDDYGVPRARRLELGFEISDESIARLKERFAYRIRLTHAPAFV
jgi:DNA-binding transcriptional regulator YhcF (GntR family)